MRKVSFHPLRLAAGSICDHAGDLFLLQLLRIACWAVLLVPFLLPISAKAAITAAAVLLFFVCYPLRALTNAYACELLGAAPSVPGYLTAVCTGLFRVLFFLPFACPAAYCGYMGYRYYFVLPMSHFSRDTLAMGARIFPSMAEAVQMLYGQYLMLAIVILSLLLLLLGGRLASALDYTAFRAKKISDVFHRSGRIFHRHGFAYLLHGLGHLALASFSVLVLFLPFAIELADYLQLLSGDTMTKLSMLIMFIQNGLLGPRAVPVFLVCYSFLYLPLLLFRWVHNAALMVTYEQ